MIKITNNMEEVELVPNAVAYFTAEWCNPCKQLKPQMAKAGIEDDNNVYFVIDVDKISGVYLDKYNIKSVPKVFKMSNGIIVKEIDARTSNEIIEEINS
jgi:thioredoxin-like negative regulator of GroEL